MLRDVTERDYGIDCYVELVKPDGFLRGDTVSIQLKGKDEITWKSDATTYVDLTGIKKSTAEYWMKIEVPVFLVLTDRKQESAYALPIKQYIRKCYRTFVENQSFSVCVHESSLFNVERFWAEYQKERDYEKFKRHLVSLLVNIERHADFIASNKGRHEYFEVEHFRHLYLISLIESCSFLARYLDIVWSVPSMEELYARDLELWKDKFCTLHEGSLTLALNRLTIVFPEIVERSLEIVNQTESSFWINTENTLFNLINSSDVQAITESLASRLHL